MKKILYCTIFIFFCLFDILDIKALEIDGEKYKIEIINDYFEEVAYIDGFKVISKINKETSDLDKGIINVDITFDNYQNNEIIYVIDNISDFNLKTSQLNNLKENIKSLFDKDYVKQGVVVTTKDNKFVTFGFDNIKTELDKIDSIESGNPGDIFSAIKYASTLFTINTNTNKSIVLIVNSLGSEDIEMLKNKINNIVSNNINLFVFNNNSSINADNYAEIFASANYICINSYKKNYCEISSTYKNLAVYPCSKTFGNFNTYLDDNIVNNFDVNIYPYGYLIAGYYDKMIKFNFYNGMEGYNVSEGKKANLLSYSISLKDNFDKNLIGKEIYISKNIEGKFSTDFLCDYRINDAGISIYGGAAFDKEVFNLNDKLSFKLIKEELKEEESKEEEPKEEIENPETGIEGIAIVGLFVLGILLIFIKFKSKDKIKRI